MNAKERVRTAMRRGKPDRVPFIPQICVPHAARVLGLPFEETLLDVVKNPLRMNKLTFECVKMYGVDGLRAWIPPDPQDVVKVGEYWHGRDPRTGEVLGRVDFEGGGGVLPSDEPTIETDEDIDAIPAPTPAEILRSGKLDGIEAIIDEAGEDYFVISAPPAFSVEELTWMRGKMQAMMDLYDRPEFCHKYLEKAYTISINHAKALIDIGIHGLMLGDTYGGVVAPHHFKEFCQAYWIRWVKEIRAYNPDVIIYLHICGHSSHLFELMADTGVDCIEPLDNLGGVSVADARRRVGHRVALMGGMNTYRLAHGTLEEVIADTRRCLDEGASGGGYTLASGDMLPTETSVEKVRTMLEMAKAYRYEAVVSG